jgi:predicted acylesterase/phospholipase RssA
MLDRRDFMKALGAAGLTPGLTAAALGGPPFTPLARALVLSGGGARGAYEAGIIAGLAAKAGVSDGVPLSPYGIVCGTSIGALNGWFVATGQYTKLHDLWYGISAKKLIRFKPQFAALNDPQSGAANRLASAIRLASLMKNQVALLDSQPALDWIAQVVDPEAPLLMPLIWVSTNLTMQRPEYFYARPRNAPANVPKEVIASLELVLGPHTIVREATPDLLHRELFASAAIPLAWDPVQLPGPDGSINQYCDGGVASNSPVSFAHAVASAADVILMDPPFEPVTDYEDAAGIGFGVFGTMQRKILVTDMRNVYFQSLAKRAFASNPNTVVMANAKEQQLFDSFMASSLATDLFFMRPKETLPLGAGAFDDEEGIGKAYRIGWYDAFRGFTAYDWKTFDV